MKTVSVNIYQFSELSEESKEKARAWYRSCSDSSDLDSVVDDFVSIAELIGLELSTRPVKLMNGKSREEPEIYYSVGYCQSDYAAFSGTWKYKKGCLQAVKDYAPKDSELINIVSEWCAIQKTNFYRLRAICSERLVNQYVNEVLKGYSSRYDEEAVNRETEREAENLVDRLASWLYDQLRNEVDYQSSDEYVDDCITANEYDFLENGERA